MERDFPLRSLSALESRVVLGLAERGRREIQRHDVIQMLGSSPQAADHIIRSLRRKGWLARASWGRYLLIPPDRGPEALGESNILALASQIANPCYIGYGTAATQYGLTTQVRTVVWLVTPRRARDRVIHETLIRIIHPGARKFFGFATVDVLGYPVPLSDWEKTAIDCIDRPELAGGVGEAASILAAATRRADWEKVADYLERIGSASLACRFGWLADHVGAELPTGMRNRLQRFVGRTRATFLGPRKPLPDALGYDATWSIFVNANAADLRPSANAARKYSISKER